ncbi:MAG: glycosyltransferase family 39 protein [Elusimicrobia bacterium]|nr:glycosyltransferase family 39 protein [Elusimicrobiota bacterium]
MRSKKIFLNILVWMFFILHGTIFLSLLPLWEGFDEWLHYSYIAYLSRTGKIPDQTSPSVPEEIFESLKIIPGSLENNHMEYKTFWELPEKLLTDKLHAIASLKNDDRSPLTISNWQSQHPPLYYRLFSPIYKIYNNSNLVHTVIILRWISIILVSLGFLPLYYLFRIFFSPLESTLGLLFFTIYPSTFILFGHLTNDALAFPLFSSLILLCFLQLKNGISRIHSILIGCSLGLGIITKLYFLTATIPITFIYLVSFISYKHERKLILINFLILIIIACSLSMPWFYHNWHTYGTWNSTFHATIIKDINFLDKFNFLTKVNWKNFFISNKIGLLWAGNWSFVSFPSFIYKCFSCLLLAISLIFSFKLIHCPLDKNKNDFLLVLFSISFLFGLMHHQLQIRTAGTMDSMGGWYWSILLPNHILIYMISLKFITKKYFQLFLFSTVVLTYLLTLWGQFNFLLPYYSGYFEKEVLSHHLINKYPFLTALQRISSLNGISNHGILFFIVMEILLFNTILFFLWTQMKRKIIFNNIEPTS